MQLDPSYRTLTLDKKTIPPFVGLDNEYQRVQLAENLKKKTEKQSIQKNAWQYTDIFFFINSIVSN